MIAFRGLLNGDTVDWRDTRIRMMHPPGHAPARPTDVPILIAAQGPKGLNVATELADGLFSVNGQTRFATQFDWATLGVHGTVLADGEPLDSPRVQAAAGPGNALAYHAAYEFGGDVTTLPAGDVWLDIINRTPPRDRHLAVHDQHLIALNHADTAAWPAGGWQAIPQTTLTGTAHDIARRIGDIAAEGITEIIYQPTGPDIPAELEAFHTAARSATTPRHTTTIGTRRPEHLGTGNHDWKERPSDQAAPKRPATTSSCGLFRRASIRSSSARAGFPKSMMRSQRSVPGCGPSSASRFCKTQRSEL